MILIGSATPSVVTWDAMWLTWLHRTRCLVSLGTDGQDGPTDAAGACVDGKTWERGLDTKLDPLDFLDRFDSYAFFDKEGGLVRLGGNSVPSCATRHPL